MKKQFKSYFEFSTKEFSIFLLLILLVGGFLLYPKIFNSNKNTITSYNNLEQPSSKQLTTPLDIETKSKDYDQKKYSGIKENELEGTRVITPFNFDPNLLDANGFTKLGLSSKTIKTILNYRNKGGKFYKAEDFRKIWGLTKKEADILIPFIVLENSPSNYKQKNLTENKSFIPKSICINTATAFELKSLPSVGNLAFKIVNFREKLGGFITINQVAETYGITDSIFKAITPYLTIKNFTINKLNINQTNEYELSKHPYISKEVARAIIIFRTQHGLYNSVDDLKKIVFLKSDVIDKIKPYLTI
jgi:competence protein ComEA